MSEGGKQAIKADDDVVATAVVRKLKQRHRELERVLRWKALENEVLNEAIAVTLNKKQISR